MGRERLGEPSDQDADLNPSKREKEERTSSRWKHFTQQCHSQESSAWLQGVLSEDAEPE